MGDERSGAYDSEKPIHKVTLGKYAIARTPVTNAQFAIYVKAAGCQPPEYWGGDRPPRGLGEPSGRECELECGAGILPLAGQGDREEGQSAQRGRSGRRQRVGTKDQRRYPCGDDFDTSRANTSELRLGDTTPVGIFLGGASPYGLLDMSGNVWEWTRSLKGDYPYPGEGPERVAREDLLAGKRYPPGAAWRLLPTTLGGGGVPRLPPLVRSWQLRLACRISAGGLPILTLDFDHSGTLAL